MLTPVKSINLDVAAIAGATFFETIDESTTTLTGSLSDLLESEQKELQRLLKNANGDLQKLDEFFIFAKELAEKKRIEWHAPLVVKSHAELLVASTAKGNFPVSEKILNHFMECIYPATLSVKNDGVSYRITVIACQGLIMTVALKNVELKK